jgi:hypothetical protein
VVARAKHGAELSGPLTAVVVPLGSTAQPLEGGSHCAVTHGAIGAEALQPRSAADGKQPGSGKLVDGVNDDSTERGGPHSTDITGHAKGIRAHGLSGPAELQNPDAACSAVCCACLAPILSEYDKEALALLAALGVPPAFTVRATLHKLNVCHQSQSTR